MNASSLIRQLHRWIAIIFAGCAAVVVVATMTGNEPAEWVYMLPLVPLLFLAITGLYLFILPYARRWRRGQSSEEVGD